MIVLKNRPHETYDGFIQFFVHLRIPVQLIEYWPAGKETRELIAKHGFQLRHFPKLVC